MNTPSDQDWDELRRMVIGLGAGSMRKSHFPSLRQRLLDLERFRAMVDLSDDLLFVLEAETHAIIDLNEMACRRLGRSRSELRQTPFPRQLQGEARAALERWMGDADRCLRERLTLVSELRSASGTAFPAEIVARCGAFGESRYAVLAVRDITERVQAEQTLRKSESRLRRSNEELQRFTSVVAHDLKAPLRAVHGLSGWIEDEVAAHLSPEGRNRMQLLRDRVQRMDALIDALLEYARAGGEAAELQEVDTAQLVREVIGSHGVPDGFTVSVDPGLPTLCADRAQLWQVFANLIANAIEHHDRSDGHVRVTARDLDEFYEFSVADDGPGIPPPYQRQIFEMFQRLDPHKGKGTGIGLAVVKKMVESAGGRIGLSSAPGEGATFRFTWPKETPAAT